MVALPPGAKTVVVRCRGDGQLWKLNLGLSHSLMSSAPTWTHDFLTTKGVTETYRLPLDEFAAQNRGRKVEGVALERGAVCYIGLILSLVDQDGAPNKHFGDGPFELVLESIAFE